MAEPMYVFCLWVRGSLIGIYHTKDLAEAAVKDFLSGPWHIEKRMVEQ